MNEKTKALIALALMVFLFSGLVIVAKFFSAQNPSMFLFFLRMLFASLAFLPFFAKTAVWKKEKFTNLVFASLFSSANVSFFMWGIEYTTASSSQIIYAAMPILTVLISNFFLGTKYRLKELAGILIGFAGIIYIIYMSSQSTGKSIFGSLTGNIAMIVAMSGWLTYIFLSKKLSRIFTPLEIGSTSILTSFAISSILFPFQVFISGKLPMLNTSVVTAGLFMGVFGTFTTYLLMQYAVRRLSPLTVTLTSYVQPVTTAFFAAIFLQESLTLSFAFCSILVFLGVFLTAGSEKQH